MIYFLVTAFLGGILVGRLTKETKKIFNLYLTPDTLIVIDDEPAKRATKRNSGSKSKRK